MTDAGDLRSHLQRVLRHLQWADENTFPGLQAAGAPATAQERFMHVIAAEHVWLVRIRGQPQRFPVWPPFTADGCRALLEENHRGYAALLDGPDGAALQREITYTTSDGRKFTNTVADILQHVALHGSWHRGQIAMLLRQAGLQPFSSDYIAHVRGGATARTERK